MVLNTVWLEGWVLGSLTAWRESRATALILNPWQYCTGIRWAAEKTSEARVERCLTLFYVPL